MIFYSVLQNLNNSGIVYKRGDFMLTKPQEHSDKKAPISARKICITAVMAALVFIMTIVPRIPIPLGYAHLGDAAIFLVVLYIGRREGALAASIGSAFADFIGGFPVWIIPTIIIKYIMAEILGRVACPADGTYRLFSVRTMLGLILSGIWMVFGYTIAGAILYGSLPVGLTSAPGLLLEGVINILAAYGVGSFLNKIKSDRF
jgi:uncharacterized membrane protein